MSDKEQPKTAAQQPVVVNIVQPDRAAEGAKAMAEGRALNMDEGPVMGRYLTPAGTYVDANGEPLKDQDKG